MSIQAVAWALEQDFSYKTPKGHVRCCHAAKLVLISLANHADHTNGHCWPSAETIAKEASCAIASVYRMVAALARNGFIDVKKVRGPDGKQRSNNYWICFERKPSPWQFFADDEDEPGDPEPHDTKSPGHNCSETDSESPGPSDVRVTRHIEIEPSSLEPSDSEIVDSTRGEPPASPAEPPPPPAAPPPAPSRFDPNARRAEQDRIKAADEARRAKKLPVIEGSEPWKAWVKRGHSPALVGHIELPVFDDAGKQIGVRRDRGWYFDTLWPPKETGPPATASPDSTRKTD